MRHAPAGAVPRHRSTKAPATVKNVLRPSVNPAKTRMDSNEAVKMKATAKAD